MILPAEVDAPMQHTAPVHIMRTQVPEDTAPSPSSIPQSDGAPQGQSHSQRLSTEAIQSAASLDEQGMMQFSLEDASQLPPFSLFSSTGDITVPW